MTCGMQCVSCQVCLTHTFCDNKGCIPRIACTACEYVLLRVPEPLGWRYASVSSRDVYQVTAANANRNAGPATQPMVEIAHVRERMPDPITVVIT